MAKHIVLAAMLLGIVALAAFAADATSDNENTQNAEAQGQQPSEGTGVEDSGRGMWILLGCGAFGGLLAGVGVKGLSMPHINKEARTLDPGFAGDALFGIAGGFVIFLVLPAQFQVEDKTRALVAVAFVGGYAGRALVRLVADQVVAQAAKRVEQETEAMRKTIKRVTEEITNLPHEIKAARSSEISASDYFEEVKRIREKAAPIVLLYADVDDLREHLPTDGDLARIKIMSQLRSTLDKVAQAKKRDIFTLVHGDPDGILIVREADLKDGQAMAEQVQKQFSEMIQSNADLSIDPDQPLTLSIGVLSSSEANLANEPGKALHDRALDRLKKAKAQPGKNTIVFTDSP